MDETSVVVSGRFDDPAIRPGAIPGRGGAAGAAHVLLWSDEAAWNARRPGPKFPEDERLYFLEAIRYVDAVTLCRRPGGARRAAAAPRDFGRKPGSSTRRTTTTPSGPIAAATACNIASCGSRTWRASRLRPQNRPGPRIGNG